MEPYSSNGTINVFQPCFFFRRTRFRVPFTVVILSVPIKVCSSRSLARGSLLASRNVYQIREKQLCYSRPKTVSATPVSGQY